MFAERGVASTKVEDIEQAAGVPEGTFDFHFGSKEAVLDELVHTWLRQCSLLFAAPSDYPDTSADPHAVLDFVIERDVQFYAFLWERRATMGILAAYRNKYGSTLDMLRQDMQRRGREWLARWRQDGLIRPDVDADLAAVLMSGAHEELSRKLLKSERRPAIERWLEFTQETFVRAFGTPELIAALERRNRRQTTGIELRRSELGGTFDGAAPARARARDEN